MNFLNDRDETGLSVSEKILQIYKFQIPYYVGPLPYCMSDTKEYTRLTQNYNVWAERKEMGAIYPWNFEQKVDIKKIRSRIGFLFSINKVFGFVNRIGC